jgi:hypothetical protein
MSSTSAYTMQQDPTSQTPKTKNQKTHEETKIGFNIYQEGVKSPLT